jgi:hypothetical protein
MEDIYEIRQPLLSIQGESIYTYSVFPASSSLSVYRRIRLSVATPLGHPDFQRQYSETCPLQGPKLGVKHPLKALTMGFTYPVFQYE